MTFPKGLTVLLGILLIHSLIIAQTAPEPLTPANDSEDISWDPVQFSWSLIDTAAIYELAVTARDDFTAPVYNDFSDNNFADVYDLFSNWQFSWRVRAGFESDTADYRFSEWSQVFSFKTEYLAPENVFPFDNSEAVEYKSLMLEWQLELNPLIDNSSYTIQLSTDDAFLNIVFEESGIEDAFVIVEDLEPDTRYFWRVKYYNIHGESSWSEFFSFVTQSSPLEKVTLLSPENNSSAIPPNNIMFSWNEVIDAEIYNIEIASDSLFNDIVESTAIFSNEYNTSVQLYNTRLFWRVQAAGMNGEGEWSDIWSFQTALSAPQAPPFLLSPADSSSGYSSGEIQFIWAAVYGADTYSIEISPNSLFNGLLASDISADSTVTLDLTLQNDKYYYWRVKAANDSGSGPWSETAVFYSGQLTSLENNHFLAESFELLQNYPNPFNPSTTIRYRINKQSYVKLKIFNSVGQHIVTLVDEIRQSGLHQVLWDGLNAYGQESASGVYFYILEISNTNGQKIIKANKMTKLK